MERVKKIIQIAYEMSLLKHDNLFMIVGPEGVGKSTFELHMIEEYVKVNPVDELDIDRVGLSPEEFITGLKKAKLSQYIAFDEAGDGLYSRDGMSPLNRGIVKAYMVIRGKRLFTILVLPSFFDIDTYFRKHRVRGLFFVYKRGKVCFYNKKQINQIIEKCEKKRRIFGVTPSFRDTFPIYKGELLEAYEKKKELKIKTSLEKLYKDFVVNKKDDFLCLKCNSKDIRYRQRTDDYVCKKCGFSWEKGDGKGEGDRAYNMGSGSDEAAANSKTNPEVKVVETK